MFIIVVGVMLPLLGDFLIFFPYTFSTTLIMNIALDRVFIIIKAQVMLYIMEKTLKVNSFPIIHILISGELCFIFVTIMTYIY